MSNSPPDKNAPIKTVIVNLLIHHALTEASLSQCSVGLWGENKEQDRSHPGPPSASVLVKGTDKRSQEADRCCIWGLWGGLK